MTESIAADRKWWPLDWADEVMPPGRSSPSDFIIDAEGHYFLGYALDAKDATEHDKRYFNRRLESGDIVNFLCSDRLGSVAVTIQPDGSFAASGEVPDRATHFWLLGNPDTLAGSLQDFVEQYLHTDAISEAATETVDMAWWSDALPHKLVPHFDNGEVRLAFEAVSDAEAKQ